MSPLLDSAGATGATPGARFNAPKQPGPTKRPPNHRWLRRLVFLLAAAGIIFVAALSLMISLQARKDETQPADVIVVFGAAEYFGKPSPVLKARADHAYYLYQKKVAPFIITTGGGRDSRYSEGGVSRDYLIGLGAPANKLIAETQATDTWQSAQRVAAIMKINNMRTCVAVSDDYHIFRIKRMLETEGIVVYGSPRPYPKPIGRRERVVLVLREVLSYVLWHLHLR